MCEATSNQNDPSQTVVEVEPVRDAHTGEIIQGDEYIQAIDGACFASEAHASQAGYDRCEYCEEWFRHSDETVIFDSSTYCSISCAHDAGLEQCANCHDWFSGDRMIDINENLYCSEHCASQQGYVCCARCGQWVSTDNTFETHVSENESETWCEMCHDDCACPCYICGNSYNVSLIVYDDNSQTDLCPRCARLQAEPTIHTYGYTPPLRFFGDGHSSPFLGVELETDGGNSQEGYAYDLHNLDGFPEHFWMTYDSSLNDGIEITSHPATLDYHANNLNDLYEQIRRVALSHGYRSHEGGRCGIHVHVNRDFFGDDRTNQDLGGYKMMRLLQRFQPQFTKFSRRQSNYWCHYETNKDYSPDNTTQPEPISNVLSKADSMKDEISHTQALNFQHANTFEIRIFRGTLNLSTYFATLGLSNGLAHVARNASCHYIESINWTKLALDIIQACDEPKSREYLRSYLEAKELL